MRVPCVGCLCTHSQAPQNHGFDCWRHAIYPPCTNCYLNSLESFLILPLKIGQPPNLLSSSKGNPNLWVCKPFPLRGVTNRSIWTLTHVDPLWEEFIVGQVMTFFFKRNVHFYMEKDILEPCSRLRRMRNAIWSGKKIKLKSWKAKRSPRKRKPWQ